MKKFAALFLIFALAAGAVSAQTTQSEMLETAIAGLSGDFEKLLNGIATDVVPVLPQNAIGGQNIGIAELGDSVFYFNIIPVIGVTAGNGFMTFRNDPDYFELLDLNSMLNGLVLNQVTGALGPDLTSLLLDKVTPFPSFKINTGFKLFSDFELLMTGFIIPQAVTDLAAGAIPGFPAGLKFSVLNVGGVVRYPLVKDGPGTPGFSIGAGYFFDSFNLGLGIGELMGDMEGIDLSAASLNIATYVHTFGAEFTVSKKLLFFAPYAKLGAWYSFSGLNGTAVLTDPDKPIDGGKNVSDFALIAGTGFDLLLGPFCINIGGNYNLGTGVWGASIGTRFQF